MPKAFLDEFRRDVIVVARKGEAAITQIMEDSRVLPLALHHWLKIADREDRANSGAASVGLLRRRGT